MRKRKSQCGKPTKIVCIHASARDLGKKYVVNGTDCVCTDCLDEFMAGNEDPDRLLAVCDECFTEVVAAIADCVLQERV